MIQVKSIVFSLLLSFWHQVKLSFMLWRPWCLSLLSSSDSSSSFMSLEKISCLHVLLLPIAWALFVAQKPSSIAGQDFFPFPKTTDVVYHRCFCLLSPIYYVGSFSIVYFFWFHFRDLCLGLSDFVFLFLKPVDGRCWKKTGGAKPNQMKKKEKEIRNCLLTRADRISLEFFLYSLVQEDSQLLFRPFFSSCSFAIYRRRRCSRQGTVTTGQDDCTNLLWWLTLTVVINGKSNPSWSVESVVTGPHPWCAKRIRTDDVQWRSERERETKWVGCGHISVRFVRSAWVSLTVDNRRPYIRHGNNFLRFFVLFFYYSPPQQIYSIHILKDIRFSYS